jgi:hypothetical protein
MKRRQLFRSLVGMAAAPAAMLAVPAPKSITIHGGTPPYCKCGLALFVVATKDEASTRYLHGLVQCQNKECDQYGVHVHCEYPTIPSRPATKEEIRHFEKKCAEYDEKYR